MKKFIRQAWLFFSASIFIAFSLMTLSYCIIYWDELLAIHLFFGLVIGCLVFLYGISFILLSFGVDHDQ